MTSKLTMLFALFCMLFIMSCGGKVENNYYQTFLQPESDAAPAVDGGMDAVINPETDANAETGSDAPANPSAYCEPLSTDPEEFGYRGCCGMFAKPSYLKAGDLIKGTLSAVYYYGSDGKRYLFPSSIELDSWYAPIDATYLPVHDYSAVCDKVLEVTDTQLAAITIGGSATKRPGAYITGILTDPKRYVVDTHHLLRMASADLLEQIYPGTVKERIYLTPEVFFVGYTMGSELSSAGNYLSVAIFQQADIEVELGIKP